MPKIPRNDYANFLSEELPKHPTISINAGTILCNKVAYFISTSTMSHKKNFDYDVSRQFVAEKITENGTVVLKENIELFKKNYSNSSLIIDHWSSHGRCFLAVISRMFTDNKIIEKLIDFRVL